MRLPVILATQGVAAPEQPRIPQRLPAEIGGEGIAQAGASVSQTFLQFAQLEQEKKKIAVEQEVSLLQADAELKLGAADANLRLIERDPEAYAKKYQDLVKQTMDEVTQRAQYPESAAALQQKLAKPFAMHQVEAFKHANQLYVDRGVANLDATLDTRKTLAGVAGSDEEFQAQYAEGEQAIRAAVPIIGANKAGDTLRAFKQDILKARAYKEAHEDPTAFLENADTRFAPLNALTREELKQHARTQSETERKNRVAEWDKFYKRIEDEAETERKAQLAGLEASALKGQLTIQRLDDAKAMRIVTTREEYAALYKAATEAVKPSRPEVLQDLSIRAHRAVPAVTPGELDAAYMKGDLNRNDWKELKDKVIARGDHLKTEGLTESGKRQAQAEQILGRALGISSLYDKIDEQDKQLYDIGLRELTARSNAFGGREDPITVATEIVNRMAPVRQERLKLKVPEIGKTLRFRALDSQTAGMLLNDAVTRGLIVPNSPEHRIEQRKILDMLRAEQAAELKASGTSQQKSLRPSGTPVEKGTPE